MTQIRFNESISGYGSPDKNTEGRFSFVPDEVAYIEDEIASAWCQSGIASLIPVEPKPEPTAEFAVAPVPENASIKRVAKVSAPVPVSEKTETKTVSE